MCCISTSGEFCNSLLAQGEEVTPHKKGSASIPRPSNKQNPGNDLPCHHNPSNGFPTSEWQGACFQPIGFETALNKRRGTDHVGAGDGQKSGSATPSWIEHQTRFYMGVDMPMPLQLHLRSPRVKELNPTQTTSSWLKSQMPKK